MPTGLQTVSRRGFCSTALLFAVSGPRILNVAAASNPYGLRVGPDGALYVCEIGDHRITRIDLVSGASRVVIDGQKEPYDLRFNKDGLLFFVDMPANQVRSLDLKSGRLALVAGTGEAGFSGDGGPAASAQLKQPHSIAFDPEGRLLICDIGNHRIRMVENGVISTFAGTGEREMVANGSPRVGSPLNGPRALDFDSDGNLYLVLREGNCVLRLDRKTDTYRRIASEFKFSGPKGICCAADRSLYVADTESHTIRRIDRAGTVSVVAGTGIKGSGPLGDGRTCGLSRPHGVFVDAKGTVFIGDSENNLVRKLADRV